MSHGVSRRKAEGLLAIWNDCRSGQEELYEAWYMEEHLPERLAVPGFLWGRRYEAVDAKRRFLTIYETAAPEVLTSEAYLARLNAPTPRTQEVMRQAFENMSRTICRRTRIRGEARGSHVATMAFSGDRGVVETIRLPPSALHSEIWIAQTQPEARSQEEALRGADERISACLSVEFLREGEASSFVRTARRSFPQAETGLYRLLCALEAAKPAQEDPASGA